MGLGLIILLNHCGSSLESDSGVCVVCVYVSMCVSMCVLVGCQQRERGRKGSEDPHLKQLRIHHWNSDFSGYM